MNDARVTNEETNKIVFKKKVRKATVRNRKRNSEDSDDSDEAGVKDASVKNTVEELKILQKLRQRPSGVNVAELALGEKLTTNDGCSTSDPFNVKSGGMVNMTALKNNKVVKQDDAYDTGIGTQFNAETNKRDEDEEMLKYIEEELSKRKQNKNNEFGEGGEGTAGGDMTYCSPEEAALQAVPEHLRQSSTHRSEEMLSNQMLSGIPEVDLGIEAKIRNIEATEEAKLKLLWDRHRKKDGPSQFVPTNMAVNFVQHNRFNIDDPDAHKGKNHGGGPPPRTNSTTTTTTTNHVLQKDDIKAKRKDNGEKATDDYYYERFKKQFRRF